ncbi:hypothetical protein M1O19_03110 [Dehalococcoidia bacterium]|nr:hypothetical protein [Dehalococcoidia bacterium]MCL0076897.1 hypothetical protein [Dehalococcoidia bacterium]MCL0078497.1 hypothetical protein [Dehalococcoidia bacterium]MCL0082659.1 hypothetical protein [Dehalococcoidia bacterium]MCL0088913.1 hypothetical protein [Dehalococcoidia bacterium]
MIGGQSYIHPTAQIKGPVMIGSNCTIGFPPICLPLIRGSRFKKLTSG